MTLFRDPINPGNYSLNQAAMEGRAYSTAQVAVLDASSECHHWPRNGSMIFYKSDTQGHDEEVATSIPIDFWDQVFAGVMELWRIPGKMHDVDQLAKLIDRFPNKVIDTKPGELLSTSSVIAYLEGRDYKYNDLLFWK
jgi:hypothetical protein